MRDRKDDTTHRQIAAAKIGRPLRPNEVAHHADEDKTNNNPVNIAVKDRGVHTGEHSTGVGRRLGALRKSLRMVKEGRKLY